MADLCCLWVGPQIKFGFTDKEFPQEVEDYFVQFEDKCTLPHCCPGRVIGVLEHVRENVIKAPEFDPRNIVSLVERYGDAHISDCGWREVDREDWCIDS